MHIAPKLRSSTSTTFKTPNLQSQTCAQACVQRARLCARVCIAFEGSARAPCLPARRRRGHRVHPPGAARVLVSKATSHPPDRFHLLRYPCSLMRKMHRRRRPLP
ncbi:hypothetical protein FIBSPDRAFT_867002 [Athelia psychrophila]|uniref:Uncharacterized protein n=1 Tax=Athelia psychrophila TaxID=1759441 RepID=A0A166EBU4_9AGAM|nr:hypothetical protein FIBSPDRAFT_867002 [Fibularhizoctonia sp. CBS 109695]